MEGIQNKHRRAGQTKEEVDGKCCDMAGLHKVQSIWQGDQRNPMVWKRGQCDGMAGFLTKAPSGIHPILVRDSTSRVINPNPPPWITFNWHARRIAIKLCLCISRLISMCLYFFFNFYVCVFVFVLQFVFLIPTDRTTAASQVTSRLHCM